MKGCEDLYELLSASLDGELTEVERRRLEEHLAACEACRIERAEMERVWKGLGILGDVKTPPGLAERVLRRILALPTGIRRRGRLARWAYSLAAAAAVLVTTLVVGHLMTRNETLDPETRQIVRNFDLLQNLDVLEHLDVLEKMGDGVLVVPAEDTTDSVNGGGS